MKAAIVVFPGTNRERDMALALKRASGREPLMLWHGEHELPPGLDLVVLPGGFSHGDYLRCGAMAAQSPIMQSIKDFANKGGHVLGVCNGFQILTEAGLLPGALLRNADLRFLSMDTVLRVERTATPYTSRWNQGATFRAPMAHGDGNYFADDDTLDRLEGENLVAFRYADRNRNGASRDIAGILSPNLRILGMMPHPENYADPLTGGEDGLPLFQSIAETLVGA